MKRITQIMCLIVSFICFFSCEGVETINVESVSLDKDKLTLIEGGGNLFP